MSTQITQIGSIQNILSEIEFQRKRVHEKAKSAVGNHQKTSVTHPNGTRKENSTKCQNQSEPEQISYKSSNSITSVK